MERDPRDDRRRRQRRRVQRQRRAVVLLLAVMIGAVGLAAALKGGGDSGTATAAGQGIQVVTIFQDLAQARSRYGEAADTILANHRAKLFLSGISDARTLEYLGRALGDEEVGYESQTHGDRGSTSRTRGTRTRRLAPADALRGIAPGEAILVYGHLPPARLALRPWYRERSLRGLAARGKAVR